MFDMVLNIPLDYLICFAVVLRDILGIVWYMPNWLSLQTFPLFRSHTWKYNIQANKTIIRKMITIQFDVFDLSFIFFIAMSQTVIVINRSGACYFLHASNMVRWIYSAKLCEKIPMPKNSYRYFKYRRFCQIQSFPLVWSSPAPGWKKKWPRKILNFEVNGSYPRGSPKNGSTTLEVTLINYDYQLFKIEVNGEMQSNHSDMLQSPTLVVREKKDNKLDSKKVVSK